MSLLSGWRKRVRAILRRGVVERELDAELRFHVEMEIQENLRRGMRPGDARRAALLAFGGVERFREATRDARGAQWLDALRSDARHSLRTLRREPGFAALAMLTLALGIGASTAVFTVVEAVLLRPLPYGDADRLTMIWSQWEGFPKTWVSVPEYQLYRRDASSYDALALFGTGESVITGGDVPRHVHTAQVTPNLFSVLGVAPAAGRTFTDDEAREEADVVVISHRLWRERYGEDPSLVGGSIVVDGTPRVVIGVMREGFKLPTDFAGGPETELWTPGYIPDGPVDVPAAGGSHSYYVVGRLKAEVPVERARAEVEAIIARLDADGVYPATWRFRPLVVPVTTEIVGDVRPALLVVFGAVAFVLLIACTNVANLLLSRLERRERELAVRTALGAGRGRLVRQLLTDSLVLAAFGAAGGLLIAWALVRALVRTRPDLLPSTGQPQIDAGVLLFALGASVLAAALVGVLPALRVAEADLHEGLREGARGIGGRRAGRFRGTLVVAQTAMAILLLVGAGLMVRTYAALAGIDPGFRAEEVLTMRLATPAGSYAARENVVSYYRSLLERVRSIPGVASAGVVRLLPLASEIGDAGIVIDGYASAPHESVTADWQIASPGYFESLDIPVIEGRTFRTSDDLAGAPVMVVNQAFVQRYLADREVIGTRVRIGNEARPWSTIVGVVGNVTHNGITAEIKPMWFRPHAQFVEFSVSAQRRMTLVVRASGRRATALEPAVLRTIRELDPAMAATDVRTLADVRASSVARPRFTLALLGAFSLLAVIVAASGLYGVISYGVARRSRELGVRIALGARRLDIVSLVMRGGLAMVALGIGVGVIAAVALTRFLETQLYGVTSLDPSTYGLVCAVFVLVALAATWLPARRAAAVQPMDALRAD